MAHPATRLLQVIRCSSNLPHHWNFVVCVLELIEDIDPRDALRVNPVDDILLRLEEANICLTEDRMISFMQLFQPLRTRFPVCNPLDPTSNLPTPPGPPPFNP